MAEGANSKIEFANLVKNHPNLIINRFEGPKGFGVEFKTSASAEEKKSFLADYNLMAEKENLPKATFDNEIGMADAFAEAVQNINSKNIRFESSKFRKDDPQYQIDPLNRMMLENSHTIESLNISNSKAKELFKLPNSVTDDVIVKVINRSKQSGEENIDLDLNISYPMVQCDDKGNILRTRSGDPAIKMQTAENYLKSKFGTDNFTLKNQVDFARNMTANLKNLSVTAQSHLDLISYLKAHPEITSLYDKPINEKRTVGEIFEFLKPNN